MVSDSEGFKYPKIDLEKCIGCKKCEKICPAINKTSPEKEIGEHCFVGYSQISKIRKNSSSGGIFYHLAEKVINENGVVFGASMMGRQVKHTFAETKEQLRQFMGSKYVQSDMGECYQKAEEFLKSGKNVLFSGTPCQIKGLYAYLGKDYPNLLTQDIICHGVPSPMVWDKYVAFKADSENLQISFRDKKYGWHYWSLKIKDGKKVSLKTLEHDWYLKLFLDNTILRPSCYYCKAKEQGSSADITIADCWSPHKVCNTIKDTDEGLSLILVNSKQGNDFFEELLSSNELFAKEVEREKALASQSAISTSVSCNPKRAAFFQAINKVNIEDLYKNWYKKSIIRNVKRKVVFLKTKIKLSQLKKELGNDLYNVTITSPRKVCAEDLIFLINQYISHKITLQEIVDWVNVVWFTDLFEYNTSEEESIASVISLLETLDEDDVQFSNKELMDMIECLSNNKVYKCS